MEADPEITNSAAVQPQPKAPVATSPIQTQLFRAEPDNQMRSDLNKFLGETTKYTVLALFFLYSVGFIIWHSYLGTYGVSSFGFLQTEYLSAALCYILIVVCFAIPPAILIERFAENDKTHPVSYLIFVWYLATIQLVGMFFPDKSGSNITLKYMEVGFIFIIIYVAIMLYGRKKWQGKKAYETIFKFDVYSLFLVGYIFTTILSNHDANKWFLAYTVLIYVMLTHYSGKDIRQVWKPSGYKMRLLLLTLSGLILLSHILLFGSVQFGKIGRQLGGGKPETAYVKFSKEHLDIPLALGIPNCTNSMISAQFCGPVDLLLRTDRELIFLITCEGSAPNFITNEVVLMQTNQTVCTATNYSVHVSTNKNGDVTTNIQTSVVSETVTNSMAFGKNVIPNLTKLSARQVRSELIESVIFSR